MASIQYSLPSDKAKKSDLGVYLITNIQKELETSLAKLILSNEIKERDKVDVILENDEIKFKVIK